MVNSGSFDSDEHGDRNAKPSFIQSNNTTASSQSSSPVTASVVSLCKTDFSQTADSDLPSVAHAIEPTPTKTEFNSTMPVENYTDLSVGGPPERDLRLNVDEAETETQDENAAKTSLCCSLPLDKVQGVLTTYNHPPSVTKPEEEGEVKVKQLSSRKLLCLYCDRTFVSANLRQKHVERCHSVKQNRRVSSRRQNPLTVTPCVYCDKLNTSEHTLKDLFQHLVNDHSNKYFGCSSCEDRFLTLSLLADHNASIHQILPPESSVQSKSPPKSPTTIETQTKTEEVDDGDQEPDEIPVKLTRSMMKSKSELQEEAANAKKSSGGVSKKTKLRDIHNKKMSVKSSRIALKRSKRLQAKLPESQKNKRSKKYDKKTPSIKNEPSNSTKSIEKSKSSSLSCVNPYPEFDSFFRVKKITDHSIDNLKISSLTFDDVFDKAFFNRIKCNIQENLLHHIDGKLFKNEESESRISNFEKTSSVPQEIQNANTENYGCELSLNAVTPVASLSLTSQFGEDFESQIEYGSKPSKKKTQPRQDEVHYKYFTRRKYQASILEHKENRDLSKLDMWTQLVIKKRQQKMLDDKKTAKEMLEYAACEEYKNKIKREELNRILDRRGPFEDLKEEASKKAAFEKLNSQSGDSISEESFSVVREVLNEVLSKVFEIAEESTSKIVGKQDLTFLVRSDLGDEPLEIREIPSFLNLRRSSSLPSDEIDQSDKIALICSSQETENYELPTNTVRGRNEMVELTGEWARCRMYICAACGAKLPNMKLLLDHKSVYHQNVWVQHYEFVGNQSELYRHLCIPGLGKIGAVETSVQCKSWKRSSARLCTKCGKQCNSLGELHRHVLECGGDWTWMLARKKCKYRPYGAKSRRKRRGLLKRTHHMQKTEGTEKKTYKKAFDGPRQKPSDADTIERMLANLPAKRSTRKLISLHDGIYKARKKNQINSNNKQTKIKCGKVIYRNSNKSNDQVNTTSKLTSNAQKNNITKNKRAVSRSINKVLSSRILDTNSTLRVKRKLQSRSQRVTRLHKSAIVEEEIVEEFEDIPIVDKTPIKLKASKPTKLKQPIATEDEVKPAEETFKRSSPRLDKAAEATLEEVTAEKKITVKKILTGKINIKTFFPVKKKRGRGANKPVESSDITTRGKRRSKETTVEQEIPLEEAAPTVVEEINEKVDDASTKTSVFNNLVKSFSMKKKNNKKKVKDNEEVSVEAETKTELAVFKEPLIKAETGKKMTKKRKLTRSFRNVIKRMKNNLTETESIVQVDGSPPAIAEIVAKNSDSFLDENKIIATMVRDKIVTPSTLEKNENIVNISTPDPTVSNYSDCKEDPPIPETIFNLDSSNEIDLQAKGELDFDIQESTVNIEVNTNLSDKTETVLLLEEIKPISPVIESEALLPIIENETNIVPVIENEPSVTPVVENELIVEIQPSIKITLTEIHEEDKPTEKLEPITIDTTSKTQNAPLLSPKAKGKLRKPARGLNDCIAMLTSKLQQKTVEDEPTKVTTVVEEVNIPVIQKTECILRIPSFQVSKEPLPYVQEEFALDLTKKAPINDLQEVSIIEETVMVETVLPAKIVEEIPPGSPPTYFCSTVDKIIEAVVENKMIKESEAWSSIDDIIKTVVDNSCETVSKTVEIVDDVKGFSRSFLEETIDFVANGGTFLTKFEDSKNSEETVLENKEIRKIGSIRKRKGRKPKTEETKLPTGIVDQMFNVVDSQNNDVALNNAFIDNKQEYIAVSKIKKPGRKVGQKRNRRAPINIGKKELPKEENNLPQNVKILLETDVDTLLSVKEIQTKSDITETPNNYENNMELLNEDEPLLLENKIVEQSLVTKVSDPSDSEDDVPLAVLINPEQTAKTEEILKEAESLEAPEKISNTNSSIVEAIPTTVEETTKLKDITFEEIGAEINTEPDIIKVVIKKKRGRTSKSRVSKSIIETNMNEVPTEVKEPIIENVINEDKPNVEFANEAENIVPIVLENEVNAENVKVIADNTEVFVGNNKITAENSEVIVNNVVVTENTGNAEVKLKKIVGRKSRVPKVATPLESAKSRLLRSTSNSRLPNACLNEEINNIDLPIDQILPVIEKTANTSKQVKRRPGRPKKNSFNLNENCDSFTKIIVDDGSNVQQLTDIPQVANNDPTAPNTTADAAQIKLIAETVMFEEVPHIAEEKAIEEAAVKAVCKRGRRKSKASKKIEDKSLNNDLFEDFSLVIKKKGKVGRKPVPVIIETDNSFMEQKSVPLDTEITSDTTFNPKNEDIVEPLDMELDEIPIVAAIIEREIPQNICKSNVEPLLVEPVFVDNFVKTNIKKNRLANAKKDDVDTSSKRFTRNCLQKEINEETSPLFNDITGNNCDLLKLNIIESVINIDPLNNKIIDKDLNDIARSFVIENEKLASINHFDFVDEAEPALVEPIFNLKKSIKGVNKMAKTKKNKRKKPKLAESCDLTSSKTTVTEEDLSNTCETLSSESLEVLENVYTFKEEDEIQQPKKKARRSTRKSLVTLEPTVNFLNETADITKFIENEKDHALDSVRIPNSSEKLEEFSEETNVFSVNIDEDNLEVNQEESLNKSLNKVSNVNNKQKTRKKSRQAKDAFIHSSSEDLNQIMETNGEIKENSLNTMESPNGRRKTSRSAKSKALENILDDALAELTESERNRDVLIFDNETEKINTISVLPQDETRVDFAKKVNNTSQKSKENKQIQGTDDINVEENLSSAEEAREINNFSIVTETCEFVNDITVNDDINAITTNISQKVVAEPPVENIVAEDLNEEPEIQQSEDGLRRSRRSSRKIASYNENELAEPILQLETVKKKSRKKELKISEKPESVETASDVVSKNLPPPPLLPNQQDKKLNSEELFDLLKATTDNIYIPKPKNSFLDNLDECSNEFNDDNFDVFDNILEKSIATIEENLTTATTIKDKLDIDKIYEFTESSPENTNQAKDQALVVVQRVVQQVPEKMTRKKSGKRKKKLLNTSISSQDNTVSSFDAVNNETSNSVSTTLDSQESESIKGKSDKLPDKSNYCEICNKSFTRIENLIKHKRTLTHISKLSEIEAKEAEEKAKLLDQREDEVSKFSDFEIISETSKNDDINISNILQNSTITKQRNSTESPVMHPSFSVNTNNHSLKLADIINDVLNKPVLEVDTDKHTNFADIIMQNTSDVQPEFRRYKSLGERKSFDSENPVNDTKNSPSYYEQSISKTTLEKQISLLQNIIENQTGVNYIDDISMSSNQSARRSPSELSINSLKQDDESNITFLNSSNMTNNLIKPNTSDESFLKPTQYEEISEDSANLRNYDDQKLRKTLNRDEELFLECCSLLKSGSEVSSYSKKSNKVTNVINNMDLKQCDEPEEWLERKSLALKPAFDVVDVYSDNSRALTPLGDSCAEDASNSNTISSNWEMNRKDFDEGSLYKEENEGFTFEEVLQNNEVSNKKQGGKAWKNITKFGGMLTKSIKSQINAVSKKITQKKVPCEEKELPASSFLDIKKNEEFSDGSTCDSKKMLTKGAMKVFEGLKVSIPTEELNLEEVLNCSPRPKKVDLDKMKGDQASSSTEEVFSPSKPSRTARKSKPVKNKSQFGSNLLFKMNKKKVMPKKKKQSSEKSSDIYDFEETQDNCEVFAKPDFRSFRTNKKSDDPSKNDPDFADDESQDNTNSFNVEVTSTTSSISSQSTASTKKPKAQQNLTKKKCMIMGRIFKNALKSKPDEETRDTPATENSPLVENFIDNCNESTKEAIVKPKMSEIELNQLFDKLLTEKVNEKAQSETKSVASKSKSEVKSVEKRKIKLKNRKRARANSESTDDEFSINKTTKKRTNRKNAKVEDNCINLEQELKECIGVASRKSQRKCTSGKQNVLVEYWSSDDSAFEALLESQRLESTINTTIALEVTQTPEPEILTPVLEEPTSLKATDLPVINHMPIIIPIKPKNTVERKLVKKRKQLSTGDKKPLKINGNSDKSSEAASGNNRRKRAAANPLYHWSSSSEDETQDLIEVKPDRDEVYEEDRPVQHGWIVGDSPKKLVTMLAQAKGNKKIEVDSVKEQGKKRVTAVS